jgi:hypothetical protein
MSKKLIAVASAAALALSALVVMPTAATAAVGPFAVAATGSQATNQVVRDGSTSAKALEVSVPTSDVLRWVTENGGGEDDPAVDPADLTGSAIQLVVTTPGVSDAITVTTTGGVKVITDTVYTETAPAATSASGLTSLSGAAATGTATFYVYTTSTAVGTVVVSAAGSSRTLYIKGLSTFAYKLAFTGPTSVAPGAMATFTGTVKDMFGNDLTTALATTDFSITAVGGSAASVPTTLGVLGDYDYNATTKVYTIKHKSRDSAGSYAVSINADSVERNAVKVTAFGDLALTAFFSLNSLDPAAQIAALQAQIADMRTKARSVTLKRWNDLVMRHRALGGSAKLK